MAANVKQAIEPNNKQNSRVERLFLVLNYVKLRQFLSGRII